MPSVSATHGWILWQVAKRRLLDAGYYTYRDGMRIVVSTYDPPYETIKTLSIVNGKCSPRTVDGLIKKLSGKA